MAGFVRVDRPEGTGLDLVQLLPDAPLQVRWRPDLLGGLVTFTVRGRTVAPFVPITAHSHDY